MRELGGYPVEEGGQTAYHRFLRADDISELSESDVQFLLRYGVTSVLDLRSNGEVCRKPDVLAEVSGVDVYKRQARIRLSLLFPPTTGAVLKRRHAGQAPITLFPSLCLKLRFIIPFLIWAASRKSAVKKSNRILRWISMEGMFC